MRRNEYKLKLVDYMKKNLRKGYTADSLKFALVKQGYSRVIVEEAIKEANMSLASEAPVLHDKPNITYEVMDQDNQPVEVKKSWWKRLFGL